MNLQELIAERDNLIEMERSLVKTLREDVLRLFQHLRTESMYIRTYALLQVPYTPSSYLGMIMWPNADVLTGRRKTIITTLTEAQADALAQSVFQDNLRGIVFDTGITYQWEFDFRGDGWVELVVEVL